MTTEGKDMALLTPYDASSSNARAPVEMWLFSNMLMKSLVCSDMFKWSVAIFSEV